MILWQGHSCSHRFVPRGRAQLCAGCCFEAVGAGSSISRWLWLQHHPVMARCAFRGQEGCLPSPDVSCRCPAPPASREGSAFLSTSCLILVQVTKCSYWEAAGSHLCSFLHQFLHNVCHQALQGRFLSSRAQSHKQSRGFSPRRCGAAFPICKHLA